MPHRPGLAVGRVEIGRGGRLLRQRLVAGQQRVQARRYRKALLGQADGRREQVRPGQLAVLLVRQLQPAQQSRRGHGHAVVDGLREGQGLAVGIKEAVLASGHRRGFTGIVGQDALLPRRVQHQESAAADAGGLRLDQVQHQLRGDGRIHGAAASPQHFVARARGPGIGRHHHEMRRAHQLAFGIARRRLGIPVRRLRARAAAGGADTPAAIRTAARTARTGKGMADSGWKRWAWQPQ